MRATLPHHANRPCYGCGGTLETRRDESTPSMWSMTFCPSCGSVIVFPGVPVLLQDIFVWDHNLHGLVATGLQWCLEHPEESAAQGYELADVQKMFLKLA